MRYSDKGSHGGQATGMRRLLPTGEDVWPTHSMSRRHLFSQAVLVTKHPCALWVIGPLVGIRQTGDERTPRDCYPSRHSLAALDVRQTLSDGGGHNGITASRLSDRRSWR